MKPTNKIVAGAVALAVAVVATVMVKGPSWKKRAQERHQKSILANLTPEQAVALCGRPILDEIQASQSTVTRRLVIRNDYALAVELDFAAPASEPQKWRLTEVQDPSGEIKYQSPASQIGVLPCLDGKQEKKPHPKPIATGRARSGIGFSLPGQNLGLRRRVLRETPDPKSG